MIGQEIRIQNNKNGKSFVINDFDATDGVIALQKYPTNTPDIRVNDIQNSGRHGAQKLPYYYGGRSIILNGVIAANNQSEVFALQQKIDSVLQFENIPNYEEDLTLSYTNVAGQELSIPCSMSVATNYNRNLLEEYKMEFQVTLRSSKYYYSVVEDALEINGLLGFKFGGFNLETSVPFTLAPGYSELQEFNSTANYFTKLRLYGSDDGDVVNPRFVNYTTDEDITFVYTLKGADEYIEINGFDGKITNQDGKDVAVFLVSGDFLTLKDGVNVLSYVATLGSGTPPVAVFTIEAKKYVI